MVPLKFGIDKRFDKYTMTVSVYAPDGTVAVQSGGVEMGQGLNTKVCILCRGRNGTGSKYKDMYRVMGRS